MIGAYHQLFQIEKSFRMAKSDLQARPIYHRTRDSIEAHLTIVFAALAVSRWIEHADRLVHPQVRQDRPPLPHHPDPGRPTTSSPPPTRYPTTSARPSKRSTAERLRTSLAEGTVILTV